jgi:hypothetical protein
MTFGNVAPNNKRMDNKLEQEEEECFDLFQVGKLSENCEVDTE